MKRCFVWAVLAACVLGIGPAAAAEEYAQPLDISGVSCFTYRDYAYVPYQSACDFLGGSLGFDARRGVGDIYYGGNGLVLTVGSTRARFQGSPVRLPVPPVVIRGVLMGPVSIFHDYFYVDIEWTQAPRRVFLYGPSGWGYFDVLGYTPSYASAVLTAYGVAYAPSPFLYNGIVYVPLLDYCDFFGIPVFFEPDYDDFVCIANGIEVVLMVGSPRIYFGTESALLPGPPVIVANTVCVPEGFFIERPIRAPIRRVGSVLQLTGRFGVRQARIGSRPPARVALALPPRPERRLGIPIRPQRLPGITAPAQRPARTGLRGPARQAGPGAPPAPQVRPRPPVQGPARQPGPGAPPAPQVRPGPPVRGPQVGPSFGGPPSAPEGPGRFAPQPGGSPPSGPGFGGARTGRPLVPAPRPGRPPGLRAFPGPAEGGGAPPEVGAPGLRFGGPQGGPPEQQRPESGPPRTERPRQQRRGR